MTENTPFNTPSTSTLAHGQPRAMADTDAAPQVYVDRVSFGHMLKDATGGDDLIDDAGHTLAYFCQGVAVLDLDTAALVTWVSERQTGQLPRLLRTATAIHTSVAVDARAVGGLVHDIYGYGKVKKIARGYLMVACPFGKAILDRDQVLVAWLPKVAKSACVA